MSESGTLHRHGKIIERQTKPYVQQYTKLRYDDFSGNAKIGYANVILNYPIPKTAFISDFNINPQNRRQGEGTLFFNQIRSSLRTRGINQIALRPAMDRRTNQAELFWKSVGFTKPPERLRADVNAVLTLKV